MDDDSSHHRYESIPDWVPFFRLHGWDAEHWSNVGDPRASDAETMAWSVANNRVVFTNDIDFGTLLGITYSKGPSVIQVRTQDVLPNHLGTIVLAALQQHKPDLIAGALVVVDEARSRVRILPF